MLDELGDPGSHQDECLDLQYPSDDEVPPQGLSREEDALPLFDEEGSRVDLPFGQQSAHGSAGQLGQPSTAAANPNVPGGPLTSTISNGSRHGQRCRQQTAGGQTSRPPGRGHGKKTPATPTPDANSSIPATGTRESAEQRRAREEAEWTEIPFTAEAGAYTTFDVPEFVPGGRGRTRAETCHGDDPSLGGSSQEVKLTSDSSVLDFFGGVFHQGDSAAAAGEHERVR